MSILRPPGEPLYRGGAAPPGPPRQRILQQVRQARAGKRQQHAQVVELSTKFRGNFFFILKFEIAGRDFQPGEGLPE